MSKVSVYQHGFHREHDSKDSNPSTLLAMSDSHKSSAKIKYVSLKLDQPSSDMELISLPDKYKVRYT